MPAKTCCRSCPRCADCPVLVAAAARARRSERTTAALIEDVLLGTPPRQLPDQVVATLQSLDAARRRPRTPALAA